MSLSAEERIAAAQARRAALREENEAAKQEQRATDLEALAALEEEHGEGRVVSLPARGFAVGVPTLAVVRTPNKAQYSRYKDQVSRAEKGTSQNLDAVEIMGEACLLYPPKGELREKYFAAFPGAKLSLGAAAVKLADLAEAEEKKG